MNGGEGADAEVGGVAEGQHAALAGQQVEGAGEQRGDQHLHRGHQLARGQQPGQRAQRGHAQDQQQRA